MKKIRTLSFILFVIFTAALAMSGCANLNNTPSLQDDFSQTEDSAVGSSTIDSSPVVSAPVDSSGENDYVMSDYWLNVTTEGYETHSQNYSYGGGYILETNIGIYWENDYDYDIDTGDLRLIEYAESSLGPWIPLCAKPNCLHNSVGCNAYVPFGLSGMYNNRLYYSDGGSGLMSMALDGSDHQTELTTDRNLFELGMVSSGIMSDGYMYYRDVSYEEDKAQVFRISVEEEKATRENVEFVISSDYYFEHLSYIKPYKNYLGMFMYEETESERYWKNYLYDFETKELIDVPKELYLLFFNGDFAYFNNLENTSDIYTYNFKTGEYEKFLTVDTQKRYATYCDGTYIYVEENGKSTSADAPYIIRVYDMSGKLIAQGQMPEYRGVSDIRGSQMFYEATKDAVFFVGAEYRPCYALLKSDIANGEINFIQIYDGEISE